MHEFQCRCGFGALSLSLNGILRAKQDHAEEGCKEAQDD